ncbi:hypothetical protein KBC89_00830 [Candidatus Woesebacteria bacterium]|nr:hypothetical protein [Candidatus Woesebacteria bacterium]
MSQDELRELYDFLDDRARGELAAEAARRGREEMVVLAELYEAFLAEYNSRGRWVPMYSGRYFGSRQWKAWEANN